MKEQNQMNKSTLFIYHKNCMDGFCAAWLFHQRYPNSVFHPASYGDPVPWELIDSERRVVIADFSYPREQLELINKRAKSLIVLDHHASAERDLAGLEYCIFDMTKSGAHLTHDLLHGPAAKMHWLVRYTEDRDLWKWQLHKSKEVSAALASYPMTFKEWDAIATNLSDGFIIEGEAILRYQEQVLTKHLPAVRNYKLVDFVVPGVNATTMVSELVGKMAEGRDFAFSWYWDGDKYRYSLRSDKNGLDVSKIAGVFIGGGGHPRAAEFESKELMHWEVER